MYVLPVAPTLLNGAIKFEHMFFQYSKTIIRFSREVGHTIDKFQHMFLLFQKLFFSLDSTNRNINHHS